MGIQSLGRKIPLEKETATHPGTRAWRIPWTEEPGGLWSAGSQESDTTQTESTNAPNKIGRRYKPKLNACVCCVLQTKQGPAVSKECSDLKRTKILVRWWAAVGGVTESDTAAVT